MSNKQPHVRCRRTETSRRLPAYISRSLEDHRARRGTEAQRKRERGRGEGAKGRVNSSQTVKLLHEVYGERRIDGRRARSRRYARRRLDFQLAAYRLLVFDICFPFVELIEALSPFRTTSSPNASTGMYTTFRRMEIAGTLFSHGQDPTSRNSRRTCVEYVSIDIYIYK